MNFKGHITGGIITGAAITATAVLLSKPLAIPAPPLVLGQIFGVALFFSMFPDLDISSIPQRWFFRAIFVILLGLSYYDRYEEATLLALVAITPLLDHHRSWTHNVFSALLFPVVMACLYEYLLAREQFLNQSPVDQIANHLTNNIWLVIACIGGWYTHLSLDFYQKKKFALIRQKRPKGSLL